ncbi:MAG: SAM-dependent methyltransferase [Chloroflexota bacterium]|nr:MAG: SAM-dependent methyltransferase [Chloroflexota bacterium]
MNLNPTRTREYLKQFNFQALFIDELGWNRNPSTLTVAVDGQNYTLKTIAVQSGFVAYQCAASDGNIPPYNLRRQIEQRVAKLVREHLIIYTDRAQTTQVWQWVKREQGKPLASREHTFLRNQSGDLLIQKLDALVFTLAEQEQGIGIFDAVTRVRAGFDVERVTKKFYDRFKTEHDRFLKMVEGIPDAELERWYASVMLNRLMFIYFIQKKGFLDGDTNYLRNRLSASKKRAPDRFYREFLLPLFFQGFAQRSRDAATRALLGDVPYLNGGLFTEHYIEQQHGNAIAIPDSAFQKIFAFFDEYQWHLDDRPLRQGNEINPDVLGYIFEKYINQKQMGAYYTKEDITEYISKNTIIPYLFDAARKEFRSFQNFGILAEISRDPDRYIYDAVKTGTDKPLPPNIAAGIADVSKRADWNKPAPSEFALPTEIWREVVARRQRYDEVKQKLANGEIASINDFITYNLNIRQFAQDAIQNTDDPQALRAFWDALEKVSVLDPTCGSGAFLFAALDILEPLYEACLERMQAFVDEGSQNSEFSENSEFSVTLQVSTRGGFQKYADFNKTLARVAAHARNQNSEVLETSEFSEHQRRYFIYKSIIVNNLYGVDIMEEAIEICKLRLFLKLVAQVETADKIEPLPDIDFNIRVGNTLVGFATRAQVEQAIKFAGAGQMRMLSSEDTETMKRIDERAELADRAFQQFRLQQTELGGEVTPADKENLRGRLQALNDELNQYLAKQYGVAAPAKTKTYEARQISEVSKTLEIYQRWLASHKPFHWFVEFYGILQRGGFDVIIGNPPYVEYSKVRNEYSVKNYLTESCGNLYAFVFERSSYLASQSGWVSLIVPTPSICTERMAPLQRELTENFKVLYMSNFDATSHPGVLFIGVQYQLSIITGKRKSTKSSICITFSTHAYRWSADERLGLFDRLSYIPSSLHAELHSVPKLGTLIESEILDKLLRDERAGMQPVAKIIAKNKNKVYYRNAGNVYFRTFLTKLPEFSVDGKKTDSTTFKVLEVSPSPELVAGILSSNLFYWWWSKVSDIYHVISRDILNFKIPSLREDFSEIIKAYVAYQKDLFRQSKERTYQYHSGTARYQEMYPRNSKTLQDRIDRVLAQHYGFTDEELDFIINYDIKYRMGRDGGEENEE